MISTKPLKTRQTGCVLSSGRVTSNIVNGYSIIETLIVVASISVLTAVAIPQLIAEQLLSRSVGVTREILSQLRHPRQLAMSQRQAITIHTTNRIQADPLVTISAYGGTRIQ
jgi:Tfp pilus assembly protein FimT